MYKQNVVYPYNEILLSHREVLIDGYILQTSCPMKEARHKRLNAISHLCEVPRIGKAIEMESKVAVSRG